MEPIGRRQDVDASEQDEREQRAKRDQVKQQRQASAFADRMSKPAPAVPPTPQTQGKPVAKSSLPQTPAKPADQASTSQQTAQTNDQVMDPKMRAATQPPVDQQASLASSESITDEQGPAETSNAPLQASETDSPTLPGIVPSPLQGRAPVLPQGAATPLPVSPQQLQEIVRYASVATNADGQAEFFLGLSSAVAGGMQIRLTALGQRRLKLRLTNADEDGPADEQIHALVQALRARGIDIVEVERS